METEDKKNKKKPTLKTKLHIDKTSVRMIVEETVKIKKWIYSDEINMSIEDRQELEKILEQKKIDAFRNCIEEKKIRR